MLGWTRVLAGNPRDGLDHIDTAERLSPRDPLLFAFRMVRAMAYLLLGDHQQALKCSSLAVRQPNSHQHTLAVHVAALVGSGQLDRARDEAARLLEIDPDYSCADYARVMPYRSAEDLASVTTPLLQAGLPADSKRA
jgi:tetratricopeptide (TPR) repeat protein